MDRYANLVGHDATNAEAGSVPVSIAIVVRRTGGPEVLTPEEVSVAAPGPGEVRLRHTAIGVNYIDTYYRTGLYPAALPFVPGDQASGVVTAVGAGVAEFRSGDRAAYASQPLGAYAAERVVPADRLVSLPEPVSDEAAAASLMRGMTAEYLLRRLYPLRAGDRILVHAAAGGVGLILCQWAKHLGATVFGTVGSADKVELAREHGCDEVILYGDTDFAAAVRSLTQGRLVDVVYDSVGRDTFMTSLDCLRPRGLMVSFGNTSGKPDAVDVMDLARRGSLFLTRPTLYAYASQRRDLVACAEAFFAVITDGSVRVPAPQPFALRAADAAHRHLQDRRSATTPILVPD